MVFILTDDSFVLDCMMIAKSIYNTFIYAYLVLTALNSTISEILSTFIRILVIIIGRHLTV